MIKCYYISVANLIWAISSVGQSSRLITGRSGVRVPDGPPNLRGIAQLVEQRSPKPRAEGSSPSAPAKKRKHRFSRCFLFFVCVNRLKCSARACRASSPKRTRWVMKRGEDGAAVKICRRYKPKQILGTARGHSLTFCPLKNILIWLY